MRLKAAIDCGLFHPCVSSMYTVDAKGQEKLFIKIHYMALCGKFSKFHRYACQNIPPMHMAGGNRFQAPPSMHTAIDDASENLGTIVYGHGMTFRV